LAKLANIDLEYHVSIGRDPVWIATHDELAAFTALVLEEAEKVCANVYHQHIGPEFGEVRHGIAACELAIHSMKPEVKP